MRYKAVELYAGCGGMSEGLRQARFDVIAAVEIDEYAAKTYRLNHPDTVLFEEDIRSLHTDRIKELLDREPLHLLAGCPPCQGFSSIRRLNRKQAVEDERNDLILEFLRFAKEIRPVTIMMENVPGIVDYHLFKDVVEELRELGYRPQYKIVDVSNYGVPQRRKRLVLVGSLLGQLNVLECEMEIVTVRKTIGELEDVRKTQDPLHKIFPKHTQRIQDMISRIPKDGGSRSDLSEEEQLECHRKKNVGFNDVYGRLKWDDVSSTITGGCLNPSKGRFLHPEEDRCITAREAALLQSFPPSYKFAVDDITRGALASQIGNALPPQFCFVHARNIHTHLEKYLVDAV